LTCRSGVVSFVDPERRSTPCRRSRGLSWQIIPTRLGSLLAKPAAMYAMLRMSKLDIAAFERAAAS